MMKFDVDAVVRQMLEAASGPLAKHWKTAEPVARTEFTRIAELVAQIGTEREAGTITAEDAVDRMAMARDASRAALAAQAGLSAISAEDAINAALSAVRSLINSRLGMVVL